MALKLLNGTRFFATILQHCSEFPLALDKKEEGFLMDQEIYAKGLGGRDRRGSEGA